MSDKAEKWEDLSEFAHLKQSEDSTQRYSSHINGKAKLGTNQNQLECWEVIKWESRPQNNYQRSGLFEIHKNPCQYSVYGRTLPL